MRRSRIAVQLGRERQADAPAGAQIGDLLVRQGLDFTVLHAGIGHMRRARTRGGVPMMAVLGVARASNEDRERQNFEDGGLHA